MSPLPPMDWARLPLMFPTRTGTGWDHLARTRQISQGREDLIGLSLPVLKMQELEKCRKNLKMKGEIKRDYLMKLRT